MSAPMSLPFDLGPRPHLGYTQSRIDRVAERRLDDGWLAARISDAASRIYLIGGEMIVLKKRDTVHDPDFEPNEALALALAPHTETVFLGMFDGHACFGIGIAPAAAEALKTRNDLVVTDLR